MFRTRTRPVPATVRYVPAVIAVANGAVTVEVSPAHVDVRVTRREDGTLRIQTRRTVTA